MGRRPRAWDGPSRHVSVRLSPGERERVELAARLKGQTISGFIRAAGAAAADGLDDELEDDEPTTARARSRLRGG
jgi:hypothetical protein